MNSLMKIAGTVATAAFLLSMSACTMDTHSPEYESQLLTDPVATEEFSGFQNGTLHVGYAEDDKTVVNAVRCGGFTQNPDVVNSMMATVVDYGKSQGWESSDREVLDSKTSTTLHKDDKYGDSMTMAVLTNGKVCGENVLQISLTY